jgi:BrnA antitoxin of type II toxin-antitoxin system
MKKEYDFHRAKRAKFSGLPPEDRRSRHTKVRITILLDQDMLATQPGAAPYQTRINRALHEYIAGGGPSGPETLLSDDGFLTRLAERVAPYLTPSGPPDGGRDARAAPRRED